MINKHFTRPCWTDKGQPYRLRSNLYSIAVAKPTLVSMKSCENQLFVT